MLAENYINNTGEHWSHLADCIIEKSPEWNHSENQKSNFADESPWWEGQINIFSRRKLGENGRRIGRQIRGPVFMYPDPDTPASSTLTCFLF